MSSAVSDREEGDQQRGPDAEHDPRQDVAAQVVGAEQVPGRPGRSERVGEVGLLGRVGREHGCEQRHHERDEQHGRARHGERVAAQPPQHPAAGAAGAGLVAGDRVGGLERLGGHAASPETRTRGSMTE